MTPLILSTLAGLALGALFFGGLWFTVSRGARSPRPALWFFVSLLARMGITLGGFYLVGGGDWRRLLACLAGFVVARFTVTRALRPAPHGARHAS